MVIITGHVNARRFSAVAGAGACASVLGFFNARLFPSAEPPPLTKLVCVCVCVCVRARARVRPSSFLLRSPGRGL